MQMGRKGEIAFERLELQTCKNQGLIGKWLRQPVGGAKILDLSKFKAFADDKINMNEKIKFV